MTQVTPSRAILLTAYLAEIHSQKGWNAVRGFLKRNKIPHTFEMVDFGTGKRSGQDKHKWLNSASENEFRAHYASKLVTSRKNGWRINVMRGQMVTIHSL